MLLKGINDNECDFDQWSEFVNKKKIEFRYIELMQTGDNLNYFKKYHVPSSVFKEYLNRNKWNSILC